MFVKLLLLFLLACHTQMPDQTVPTTALGLRPHSCDISPAPIRPSILEDGHQDGALILGAEQFNAILKYEIDFVAWAQVVMACER